jgi:hypothetical protein
LLKGWSDMETTLVPIREYEWGTDYSWLRQLTCKNHPKAYYLTKNPWARSLHLIHGPDPEKPWVECECPFDDLVVVVGSGEGEAPV